MEYVPQKGKALFTFTQAFRREPSVINIATFIRWSPFLPRTNKIQSNISRLRKNDA
jgi:hypothetical protein